MRKPDGSWETFEDYVLDFALDRRRAGIRVALVTLVRIEGSSPRMLGAQMAVAQTGEWVGYLSGGCIERAVVGEALAALEEGRNRRVRYGRGSRYLDIQLPCGSAIELMFDVCVSLEELVAIDARLRARQMAAMLVPDDDGEPMIRQYWPRRRLVVIGVGPAAAQLARVGHIADFEVVLQSPDDATRLACEEHGLAAVPLHATPEAPDLQADARTAVVFMFHDHEWERTLIPAALNTEAFYIGAMGSRRTHINGLANLKAAGADTVQLGRIRGPAGLFSGAKSAPDIAMSILAEVMQVERSFNAPLALHLASSILFSKQKM